MKLSTATLLAVIGSASAFSGSSFSGSSLKASVSNDASMTMATGMGVNGFGRIGRLVTRIMMEDDDCKLNAINAGSATTDYSEYTLVWNLFDFEHIMCSLAPLSGSGI